MLPDSVTIWNVPPAALRLEAGDVHVWLASLDRPPEVVAACESILSEPERDKASRMRFAADRQRVVVGRCLLRRILGTYLRINPADLVFAYNRNGKPSLEGERGLHFNLSHSGSMALYAVTALGEVGVDLEQLRPLPEMDDIAQRWFSAEEQTVFREVSKLDQAPSEQREAVFFKLWTRKEAVAKCHGGGIAEPEIAGSFRGQVVEINPGPGFAGALATEKAPGRIQTWRWPDAHE
jgi:4'-phosphopantetheinyl transferase